MSGENPPTYQPEKTDYPPTQEAYPPAQQGYPPAQQGYPAPQQAYPPAQQGYPAPQQAPPPVQTQPTTNVIVTPSFGKASQNICCTNCKTEQVTVIRQKVGPLNMFVCGVITLVFFLLGLVMCFPFCLIPLAFIALCIPAFKDVEHVCPNCDYVNGTHQLLQSRF